MNRYDTNQNNKLIEGNIKRYGASSQDVIYCICGRLRERNAVDVFFDIFICITSRNLVEMCVYQGEPALTFFFSLKSSYANNTSCVCVPPQQISHSLVIFCVW